MSADTTETIKRAATLTAVVPGYLCLAILGLFIAGWLWVWVGSWLDAHWIVQGGITAVLWLIATAVLPAVVWVLRSMMGQVAGSMVAALGGFIAIANVDGVGWQAFVVAYALGFAVWIMD